MKCLRVLLLFFILGSCGSSQNIKILEEENWHNAKHLAYKLDKSTDTLSYTLVWKDYTSVSNAKTQLEKKREYYQQMILKRIFADQLLALRKDIDKESPSPWNSVINEIKGYGIQTYNEELEFLIDAFKKQDIENIPFQKVSEGYQVAENKVDRVKEIRVYLDLTSPYKDYLKLRDTFLEQQIKNSKSDPIRIFRKSIYKDVKVLDPK